MTAVSTITNYAVYRLLNEFDPKKEGYLSRARFYKAMYVLNRRLEKRRIDIHLPWRWYICGPVIELDLIDQSVFSVSEAEQIEEMRIEEPKGRIFYNREPRLMHVDATILVAVNYEVKKLAKEYPRTKDLVDTV